MHPKIKRLAAAAGALVLLPALVGFRYPGFGDTAGRATATQATAYLQRQQLADGSFETAGFPGFETPDAVLAIAENAQLQAKWSRPQARAAVAATTNGGVSALHAIDDLADAGLSAGQAAKLVVLVAKPLGLSLNKFDPDRDGAVSLKAIVAAGKQPNGSYGAFNATLYAAIADRVLGTPIPPDTLALIRSAQEAGGGWNFAGDNTGDFADIDTTALALQALVGAKVKKDDVDLRQGLAYLAHLHTASGAWQSFGSDDANSTAVAIMGITAAGFDPAASCWRDTAVPALKGTGYASPTAWLRTQQLGDGRIKSPNDGFGINTFATSQTIQALRREWIPVKTLGKQACK